MHNMNIKQVTWNDITDNGHFWWLYISVDIHLHVFDVCCWRSWRTYDVMTPKPCFRRRNMHITDNVIISSEALRSGMVTL